jgi:hypothetical protein
VNGSNLDDPRFFPIYEAAQDLGVALFIHPWDMLAMDRMKKYWLSLVGRYADRNFNWQSVQ